MKPEYVPIIPWNPTCEITEQTALIPSCGDRSDVPTPELVLIA